MQPSHKWIAVVLAGFGLLPIQAELSEPPTLVFGRITLDGNAVTANDGFIVVEARRSPQGAAIASYRMGSNPRAGDFYDLRIPREALEPRFDPRSVLEREILWIVVTRAGGDQDSFTLTAGDRGQLVRRDLVIGEGGGGPDNDGNGLPDVWERQYFGANSQLAGADPDGDGRTTRDEFDSGTDPTDGDDFFGLELRRLPAALEVVYRSLAAQGAAYEGKTRRYRLEQTSDLGSGLWTPVFNPADQTGDDTEVVFESPLENAPVFFRAQVWLEDL